jgi:methionyl-tRNA synthetase
VLFRSEDMSARYTSELANGLDNLASRATAMVGKYCDGILPAAHDFGAPEQVVIDSLARTVAVADEAIGALDFSTGLAAIKEFVDLVNGYVTEQEPWALAKDEANRARLEVVLYTICESLRALAVLYNPVMPKAMASLWEQLGAQAELGPLTEQRVADVARWAQLPPGTRVTKGESLFPRLEDAT